MSDSKFKNWCIVELFGHTKIAGLCTEENIAGANMLRVDVQETKNQPAYTKYYGNAAIYAITPVDEQTALMAAETIEQTPATSWSGRAFSEKYLSNKSLELAAPEDEDEDEDDSNDRGF